MQRSQLSRDNLLISPVAITNGNTSAATLDTLGNAYATIRFAQSNIVTTGVASADGVTLKLTESDVTHTSSFAAISSIADKTGRKFASEHRIEVDLKGRKRYLRASVIPGTSGVTNEPVTAAVFATLHIGENARTSTAALIAGTNDTVTIA